ncbi:MAG TPA: type II toxin-antitoxin system RelE/ParE family toxin [Thalassobaculum sp.]
MRRVQFSRAAAADLRSLACFSVTTWGKQRARDYQDALLKRLQMLAESPGMGHRRSGLADGLLCFPAESHMIYYIENNNGIWVVRVLHKRQDPVRNIG